MKDNEIIEIIKEYVKEKCENESSGHDWWHIQRVYNNAMLINKEEKANEFILTCIVLMHDLCDHKFFDGNIKEELENILKRLNVYDYILSNDRENIINSCMNLGFSSNIVNKKELSKEGKIAQDADRLDGIGAIGIARAFSYGGKVGNLMYNPTEENSITAEDYIKYGSKTSISHFYDKLLKLKDMMNTETAKEIAVKRHQYMEEFLNEFYEEWDGRK